MKNNISGQSVDLGGLSLGYSFCGYFFLQYLFTPIIWWLSFRVDSLAWTEEVFYFFEQTGRELCNHESILFSVTGLTMFAIGYRTIFPKSNELKIPLLGKNWNLAISELAAIALLGAGFGIKFWRIFRGADISAFTRFSAVSNPYIAYLLSMNWLHLLALGVINISYQEAKLSGHRNTWRLHKLALFTNFIILAASLTTSSDMGTIFPLISLLIIRQYYDPIPLRKFTPRIILVILLIFGLKNAVTSFIYERTLTASEILENTRLGISYVVFHRLNLSWVLPPVIDFGQDLYPDGTLGQFWIDFLPWRRGEGNILDGNEFGQALGLSHAKDYTTGSATTNLGDFFINFGFLGIALGMFLHGMLYRTLYLICRVRQPGSIFLYALLWPIIIHGIESPISVLYSTTLKMILLCLIIHIAISTRLSGILKLKRQV